MLMDQILTHDSMARRGMQCDLSYIMCDFCHLKIGNHLFFMCRYAYVVWQEIERNKGTRVMRVGDSIEQTWDISWEEARRGGTMTRKNWATLFMRVNWNLWKQRNEMIFQAKKQYIFRLVQQILQKVDL